MARLSDLTVALCGLLAQLSVAMHCDGHPENCYKLRASLWQNLKGDFVDEEEAIFG